MNVLKILKLNIIPLNIFQTWYTKDLPEKMRERVELLKKQNPEFTHYLFDDNECREFIKKNFDSDILNAYDSLVPGAYKADLWRLCVLYIHGGIYLDIKFACINDFKLIDLTYNNHFVRDIKHNAIYNALMVSQTENEFVYKGIRQIVKNVENKYYGLNSLYPTGPNMLGMIIKNNKLDVNVDLQNCLLGRCIIYKNKRVISTSYPKYKHEQRSLYNSINTKHYSKLWKDKNIYK
jgi:mannosyltransferase OCH1-like enzyme